MGLRVGYDAEVSTSTLILSNYSTQIECQNGMCLSIGHVGLDERTIMKSSDMHVGKQHLDLML